MSNPHAIWAYTYQQTRAAQADLIAREQRSSSLPRPGSLAYDAPGASLRERLPWPDPFERERQERREAVNRWWAEKEEKRRKWSSY